MSPKNNLFVSKIENDIGSLHPVNEMKNKLIQILEGFGFVFEEVI